MTTKQQHRRKLLQEVYVGSAVNVISAGVLGGIGLLITAWTGVWPFKEGLTDQHAALIAVLAAFTLAGCLCGVAGLERRRILRWWRTRPGVIDPKERAPLTAQRVRLTFWGLIAVAAGAEQGIWLWKRRSGVLESLIPGGPGSPHADYWYIGFVVAALLGGLRLAYFLGGWIIETRGRILDPAD